MYEQYLQYLTLNNIFLAVILCLAGSFLFYFFRSLSKNRSKVRMYSLIVKDNGQISKVGIAFIFLLVLIVYQVVTGTEVSGYLVELLGVIFAAEIGGTYVDNKSISNKDIDKISNTLHHINKSKKSASAKCIDDIDFDNL